MEDESIRILYWILAMALCTTALAVDLTGDWRAYTDTNIYIRQSNDTIWWLCEESGDNPSWISVAYGTVEGNRVTLRWADVPKANATNIGTLELNITSDQELVVINQTGGWGEAGTRILRVEG